MAILTLSEFNERRLGDREPLLDFKWHCLSMPFGFDTDYVETIGLPFPTLAVKEMYGAANSTFYPGAMSVAAFDITFYEDSKARSRNYLRMWHERIRHPSEGYYYLPSNYKRDIEVELLDTQNKPVLGVRLKGCWPTQSNAWDLTSNGNGRLTIQQNFAVDGMEYM